ncbi:unnamed protein product [Nezara viridula]|uniref:Uncharacterized protein n=1 Tax=Nezara viridula TaxID=85310 RepID=A0A9P0E561_NEZVI|nr:unnamed protein product [Nezara viridula]
MQLALAANDQDDLEILSVGADRIAEIGKTRFGEVVAVKVTRHSTYGDRFLSPLNDTFKFVSIPIGFKSFLPYVVKKQAMLVRQLEEELRLRMRGPSIEMQQQMEVLYAENEHLTREVAILRETIKV